MRRKISLYIGDRQADLDEQSFVLLNYTFEDLSNPTIVKNSFSQQITLKGTPTNNAIFGDSFRLDRRISYYGGSVGSDFNPARKTSFTIYNEMNDVLESGYVKLDSVSRKGNEVEYKVTLYGGLGSFLYVLSYDDSGNKRTLADLDYLGSDSPDTELDFVISKENVQSAWDNMPGDDVTDKWHVINFAPAYNGYPDGEFDAGKALVLPSAVGLDNEVGNYTIKSGYSLVNLASEQDEWAVKDIRSYLQRPVLNMRAFFKAIARPANNGGYSVNADAILSSPYGHLWKTLPMIPSLGTSEQKSGDITATFTPLGTTAHYVGYFNVNGEVESGTEITANLSVNHIVTMPSGATSHSTLHRSASVTYYDQEEGADMIESYESVFFAQAVAYASDGTIVGGSKVQSVYSGTKTPSDMASMCGFTPLWTDGTDNYNPRMTDSDLFGNLGDGLFKFSKPFTFTLTANNVATIGIFIWTYRIYVKKNVGTSIAPTIVKDTRPMLFPDSSDIDTRYISTRNNCTMNASGTSVSYQTSSTLRSGASITKKMLLSSSQTPADYLLSFCKMFGFYLTYDSATKAVSIVDRNSLFTDETIDLTERVDLSKDISVTPFVFTDKWYEFGLDCIEGAFAEEYESVQGMKYGIQRVDTGYDFNSETNDILSGNVFKNAVTKLGRSKYMNIITDRNSFKPSPFIDSGNTYTLWDSEGNTQETDISCPPDSASVGYYNSARGYDYPGAGKVEFCDSEGKMKDGADVLLYLDGWKHYAGFKLTDDLPAMDALNEGKPCWLIAYGSAGLTIPIFGRYVYDDDGNIDESLDFGVPRELDIPSVEYKSSSTIYARRWRKYLADRYDVNTRVMTCNVNLQGLQVNAELLRRFWWFDNSLWVLNKITNYSLTTYDSVECEFVQVQDKDNYLNGQE